MSASRPEAGDVWLDPGRGVCRVTEIARHTRTRDEFVVYREDDGELGVCPLAEFVEMFDYIHSAR